MSGEARFREAARELRDLRLCGPSDDPDEQTAVAVRFRYLLIQLQHLTSQLAPEALASQMQAIAVDVCDIYSVYDARARVDALLPDVESAIESRNSQSAPPTDLESVRQLLHVRGRDDLVRLLNRVDLEYDVSSSYGSHWNSYSATAEFHAPIEDCDELRALPEQDVALILEMIREINPPCDGGLDVSSISFLVDPLRPTLVMLHDTGAPTGWERVDRSVLELRERLKTAITPEQCQSIGHLAREILISLAQEVYEPDIHPTLDGVQASDTDAKRMLDAYLAVELAGESNKEARRHARAALDLANKLQHDRTATRANAMLCAEATTSVVNIVAILSGKRTD